MRRTGSARLCAALVGLLLAEVQAGAAPLDFLFGEPRPPAYSGTRQRHRAPRPQPHHTLPQAPAEAEIPLPVPRPHFPGDPPRTADLDATPPAAIPPREAEPQAPATPIAPTPKPDEPPLPPPKPPELAGPAAPEEKPALPAPETKPVERAVPAPAPVAPPAKEPMALPKEPVAPAVPPTPPSKPPEIAKPNETPKPGETSKPAEAPKPAPPQVAPSGATTAFTPRSPDDDPACPGRLKARGVAVEPVAIGPQPDERCTVVEAVKLSSLAMPDGTKVEFPEKPTIACTTADAFSLFVRDLMVPLSKGTFASPITAIWTGPGLECRSRDHIFGAKLSAHGQGLAIDIAKLKLADGRMIEVGDPKSDLETGFETAARAGACGYFHTVLGPGSDAYHLTHWHFDLEVRGAHGDSKYCK